MCERQTDLFLRSGCKNIEDVAVKWNYTDIPRPPVPCTVTRTLVNNDRIDRLTRPRVCRPRLQGEAGATRLLNKLNTDSYEDWDDPRDPFNNTATGFLGVRRKSMLSNPLLVKHKLGTPFRCCRKLPCDDFIYGSLPARSSSAVLALHGWNDDRDPQIRNDRTKHRSRFTNFLALNRAAISAGICGHDDWRDFRNTHRVRYSRLEDSEHERRPPPLALDPEATFGKLTSYVTTAAEIMSGQEQKDWLRYVKTCNSNKQPSINKLNPWRENHACTLRMFKKPTGLKLDIPWHLPKIEQKAKPHLSTFRKMADEISAHNSNNYEKVGRDGMFGQGIPTKACNKADALCCSKP
ncbi:hypothetical protein BsWGS_02729 [Bradybaena similaris]